MRDKVVIIAEAGVNHNGDMQLAEQLIEAAAEAGADFVKFQTFKADLLVSKAAKKATYQAKNIGDGDDSQYNMLKKLELNDEMHQELISMCRKHEIAFLSTAFDLKSIDYLDSLNIPLFKIPSGEITNLPYLRKIAKQGKETVLSTGMADMGEIEDALDVLTTNGLNRDLITVLHCNTEYPTPMEDVNLRAMLSIADAFKVNVGYSDHTLGIEVPIAAVAMGAKLIEKHFTLDRNMTGPDHKASLEPDELKLLVTSIRNIEAALGNGLKKPSPSEYKNKDIARKSLHLSKEIKADTPITEDMLVAKRPGDGISPMQINEVIGSKLKESKDEDHMLVWSDLYE